MPNYNLTIDSTFQPFSFERYIQPYAIYGEAYNQQENAITELSTKSEEFAALAESERLKNGDDSETYRRYSNYSRDLKEQADALASSGLNIKTRKATLDLKRRYESEIGSIDRAHKAMQAANVYRDTIKSKDPNAIFTINRYDSIDHFYNNDADNSYISGKDIETSVTGDVLSLAYSKYAELTQAGVKPDIAISMISSGQALDPTSLISEELTRRGYDTFDEDGQRQIMNSISSGVIKGLGTFADKQIMDAAQRDASARGWANLEESRKQHAINLEMRGYNKDGSINTNSPYWTMNGIKWETSEDGTLIPKAETKPGTGGEGRKEEVEKLNTNLVIVTKDDGSVELQDKSSKVVYSGYKKYKELSPEIQEKIITSYPGKSPAELEDYLFGIGDDGSISIKEIEKETRTINENKGADNLIFEE